MTLLARLALAAFAVGLAVLPATRLDAQIERRRPVPSEAQIERSGTMLGMHGGYDFGNEYGLVGLQGRFGLDWNLQFYPSAEIILLRNSNLWQANADLVALGRQGMFYLGGGLAAVGNGEDVKLGVNVFPGVDLGGLLDLSVKPFVEPRWTFVQGNSTFRLNFGVNVPLGLR